MNHLVTSNGDSAQNKDVWNENLELLMSSADCLFSADCLLSHLETSNADSAQSKYVWNENLEFLMSSAVCLLSADCIPGQILFRSAGHLENFPSCYYRGHCLCLRFGLLVAKLKYIGQNLKQTIKPC